MFKRVLLTAAALSFAGAALADSLTIDNESSSTIMPSCKLDQGAFKDGIAVTSAALYKYGKIFSSVTFPKKTKFIFLILSILVFSCPTNNTVMEIFFLERISKEE